MIKTLLTNPILSESFLKAINSAIRQVESSVTSVATNISTMIEKVRNGVSFSRSWQGQLERIWHGTPTVSRRTQLLRLGSGQICIVTTYSTGISPRLVLQRKGVTKWFIS
jgi:hypothetical protein